MPSTTTTNVTGSSLLDVLGTSAPAPPTSKAQPAFDELLQPPAPTSEPASPPAVPAPPAAKDPAESSPPHQIEDRSDSQAAPAQSSPGDTGDSHHESNTKAPAPQSTAS